MSESEAAGFQEGKGSNADVLMEAWGKFRREPATKPKFVTVKPRRLTAQISAVQIGQEVGAKSVGKWAQG